MDPEEYEAKFEAVSGTLYGQIRVQMEEAIEKRKDLLKAGKPASDLAIRGLEAKVMKARGLLLEHDELVEDVQPPIVERVTPPEQPGR